MMPRFLLTLGVAIGLIGCQTMPNHTNLPTPSYDTPTSQPAIDPVPDRMEKPRVLCTMQYDPVCATIDTKGIIYQKTFGNACTANNADGRVVSITKGACDSTSALRIKTVNN